jgi:hypothetical protein
MRADKITRYASLLPLDELAIKKKRAGRAANHHSQNCAMSGVGQSLFKTASQNIQDSKTLWTLCSICRPAFAQTHNENSQGR